MNRHMANQPTLPNGFFSTAKQEEGLNREQYQMNSMTKILAFLTLTLLLTPLTGCTAEEEEEAVAFPAFSSLADNDETYDNARMAGSPFIVVFSAEWCNSPCYTTMHALWAAQPELPVLVMSTDPVENATGVTLSEWHASADAHDDDDTTGDAGVSLTTYAFMKGSEVATALDITRPGSLAFVNGEGEVTYLHEGRMDDTDEILKRWSEASGTA
jgi:hypothetical protein